MDPSKSSPQSMDSLKSNNQFHRFVPKPGDIRAERGGTRDLPQCDWGMSLSYFQQLAALF